jgi:hypothetical protein
MRCSLVKDVTDCVQRGRAMGILVYSMVLGSDRDIATVVMAFKHMCMVHSSRDEQQCLNPVIHYRQPHYLIQV